MIANMTRGIGLVAFIAVPLFMIYGAGSHSGRWFFGSLAVGTMVCTACVMLAEWAGCEMESMNRDGE